MWSNCYIYGVSFLDPKLGSAIPSKSGILACLSTFTKQSNEFFETINTIQRIHCMKKNAYIGSLFSLAGIRYASNSSKYIKGTDGNNNQI